MVFCLYGVVGWMVGGWGGGVLLYVWIFGWFVVVGGVGLVFCFCDVIVIYIWWCGVVFIISVIE